MQLQERKSILHQHVQRLAPYPAALISRVDQYAHSGPPMVRIKIVQIDHPDRRHPFRKVINHKTLLFQFENIPMGLRDVLLQQITGIGSQRIPHVPPRRIVLPTIQQLQIFRLQRPEAHVTRSINSSICSKRMSG